MSNKIVQVVLTEESRWAVQTDNLIGTRVIYPSRGAAIAAGVQLAMAEDALLMIHGVSDKPSALDFSDCSASLVS